MFFRRETEAQRGEVIFIRWKSHTRPSRLEARFPPFQAIGGSLPGDMTSKPLEYTSLRVSLLA
jgi:hypothetical protein